MKKLPVVLSVTALVVAVLGATGPAMADGVRHALFAHNAGKVDGKNAVGARATLNRAAGKLVATSATGANKGKLAKKFIPRTVRWALVDEAGAAIVAQSGGISISSHPFTGEYILEFGTSLIGKGIFVTPSGRDNTLPGGVWAAPCGTNTQSYPNCSGQPTSRLHVLTEDTSGVAANQSFYVMVVD